MKQLFPLIVLGLILRLALMPAYVHPDLKGFNFGAYLISQQGRLFTFYDYLSQLPPQHQLVVQYHPDLFIYPPLAYLTPALFMRLLSPLYNWQVLQQFIFDAAKIIQSPAMVPLAIVLKLPYLVPDFICLLLITRLVDQRHRFLAGLLWLFNPVNLYSTYLIGQFDIYLVTLVLLALYFAHRNQTVLAALSLGLAAAFKPFPLFLLPFVSTKQSLFSRLMPVGVGLGAFLLVILPYLPSAGFRNYALFAPQTDKLQFAKVMVSATQYLPLFFVGLIFMLWHHYYRPQLLPTWGWFASVFLLFYSLTHFHPQWFLWATPFVILWFVSLPRSRLPLAILVGLYFALIMTFEPSLNWTIFRSDFSLMTWLDKYHMADYFASLLRGAFAATALYLVLSLSRSSPVSGGDT